MLQIYKCHVVRCLLAVFFVMLYLITPVTAYCQVNDTLFDVLGHYESVYTPEMVYIKWFSTGSKPAPEFIAMRFAGDIPVQVVGEKMIYLHNDTTFYVLQDTTAPAIRPTEVLQYFMAPHDTAGMAGRSSEIVLLSANEMGVAWFVETHVARLPKENGILLEWRYSQPESILLYEVYRSQDLYRAYTLIATVPGKETAFADHETVPDIVYYYQIQAIPISGNKATLSNVLFSASYNPQPPVPPYIEAAYPMLGGAAIHIQATDTEALGVRVYRDDGLSPVLVMVSDLLPLSDSLRVAFYDTLSDLSGRRTYTYAATTESTSFVESDFSKRVYVRPHIGQPPGAPLTLNAYEEDRHIVLFWENMQERDIGIAGYILSRSEDTAEEGESFISMLPDNTYLTFNSFSDTTVLPGHIYTYRVQSIDIDGNIGLEASIARVATQQDLPVPPFALQALSVEGGIYLNWSRADYPGLVGVNLYRYEREVAPQLIASLPADGDEYLDEQVVADTLYFYFLTTFNQQGVESVPSDEAGVVK